MFWGLAKPMYFASLNRLFEEQLPEKHLHNLVPQAERIFKHDNEQETHRRVSAEIAQFQNTSVQHQTTHSSQATPQVFGKHVHQHVHKTVQPIVHETVQPAIHDETVQPANHDETVQPVIHKETVQGATLPQYRTDTSYAQSPT